MIQLLNYALGHGFLLFSCFHLSKKIWKIFINKLNFPAKKWYLSKLLPSLTYDLLCVKVLKKILEPVKISFALKLVVFMMPSSKVNSGNWRERNTVKGLQLYSLSIYLVNSLLSALSLIFSCLFLSIKCMSRLIRKQKHTQWTGSWRERDLLLLMRMSSWERSLSVLKL